MRGIAPEPGPLPPGEGPGPPDGLLDGLGQGNRLLHVGQELAVAEGLAGRARQPPGTPGQGPDLVHAVRRRAGPAKRSVDARVARRAASKRTPTRANGVGG